MKKEYMKPTMTVVELKQQTHILAGSGKPYGDQSSPLDLYDGSDDEEDIITSMDDIW